MTVKPIFINFYSSEEEIVIVVQEGEFPRLISLGCVKSLRIDGTRRSCRMWEIIRGTIGCDNVEYYTDKENNSQILKLIAMVGIIR